MKTKRWDKASDYFKELNFNLSKIISGEWVKYPTPRRMTIKISEVPKVSEMRHELSDIVGGVLKDDTNEDTCLMGKY